MTKDILFTVADNRVIAPNVFELELRSDSALPPIISGQFLNVETPLKGAILRRPFCIYKWDESSVTVVVEKKREGTKALATLKAGDRVKAMLPLGNGFYLDESMKKVAIIGGGIGCAPLLGIMKSYPDREYRTYLGFKNKQSVMLEEDFAASCKTVICTYDGSYKRAGYQVDALKADENFKPDVIVVCGSKSLLKSVKAYSQENNIEAYVSTEERMACGIGACLGCTCKVKSDSGEIRNRRVCKDGPVFNLKDVVL